MYERRPLPRSNSNGSDHAGKSGDANDLAPWASSTSNGVIRCDWSRVCAELPALTADRLSDTPSPHARARPRPSGHALDRPPARPRSRCDQRRRVRKPLCRSGRPTRGGRGCSGYAEDPPTKGDVLHPDQHATSSALRPPARRERRSAIWRQPRRAARWDGTAGGPASASPFAPSASTKRSGSQEVLPAQTPLEGRANVVHQVLRARCKKRCAN